ncbi:MAG: hypothetical protein R3E96_08975 [Planctomycetota bacterium]
MDFDLGLVEQALVIAAQGAQLVFALLEHLGQAAHLLQARFALAQARNLGLGGLHPLLGLLPTHFEVVALGGKLLEHVRLALGLAAGRVDLLLGAVQLLGELVGLLHAGPHAAVHFLLRIRGGLEQVLELGDVRQMPLEGGFDLAHLDVVLVEGRHGRFPVRFRQPELAVPQLLLDAAHAGVALQLEQVPDEATEDDSQNQ